MVRTPKTIYTLGFALICPGPWGFAMIPMWGSIHLPWPLGLYHNSNVGINAFALALGALPYTKPNELDSAEANRKQSFT
jgi:hypothetical protein